jgi:5-methylcytosine-specific restriction endonuclease McrA
LVLDAGYQAVNVVPLRRALALLSTGKAVSVEEEAEIILHAERESFRCPVIIRLFISIAHRVYRSFRVKFNKRNLMTRDAHSCQYCGTSEAPLTIDHVIPRSRRSKRHPDGGPTTWQNCVTACIRCNLHKGNRTPEEAGMQLLTKPAAPRWYLPILHRGPGGVAHRAWRRFLSA